MSPNKVPIIPKNLLKLVEITGILILIRGLVRTISGIIPKHLTKHLTKHLARHKKLLETGTFLLLKRVSA